ncbi:hypothetical protein D3C78_1874160 [compost metagenome]
MPWKVLLNRRSRLSGVISDSGSAPFRASSMFAVKVATGAPLLTVLPTVTRLCTVPSRGIATCEPGTLTWAESAWVTK